MGHKIKRFLPIFVGITALVLLILYMGGFFATGLIGPSDELQKAKQDFSPAQTTKARKSRVTQYLEAVGTVSPRIKTRIEAQVRAQIKSIQVRPGQLVQKGELIILLEHRSLLSRLEQARQGLKAAEAQKKQARQGINAAQAAFEQAKAAYERTKTYYESEAATARDMEEARSAFLQARAGLQQARDALRQAKAGAGRAAKKVQEAQIALDHTQIKAPISGEVARRMADPGDLARPGKPLLTLQSGKDLRLEALVRENAIQNIKPGQKLQVNIEALPAALKATLQEVVPVADPDSRSFVVKAALPAAPGLYPGMFGRLQVPVGQEEVILADQKAIKRIGQLEMVTLKVRDGWQDALVLTGQKYGEQIEILSGLQGGETLALSGADHE